MKFFLKTHLPSLLVTLLCTLLLMGVYNQVNLQTPSWNISMMPALKDYPKYGPIQLTPARYVTRRTGDVWGTYVIQWHHGPGYLYLPRASAVEVDGIKLNEEFDGNGFVFEFSGSESDTIHRIAIPLTTSAASTTMYFGSYAQISEFIAISSIVINFIRGICLAVFLLALLFFYFKRSERYLVWLAVLCFLQMFYTEGDILFVRLSGLLSLPFLASPDIYLILQEVLSAFCIIQILNTGGFSEIRSFSYPLFASAPAVMAIACYHYTRISSVFLMLFQLMLYGAYLAYFIHISRKHVFEYYLLLAAWGLSASLRFYDELCEIGVLSSGYLNTTIRLKSVVSAIFIIAFFLLAGKRFALKFGEADRLNAHLEAEIQKKTAQQTVFIRSMLHNLKTPMFSLSGYSDMALRTIESNPEAAHRYIEKTHEKAVFAGSLMDQIFFATQLEAGMVQLQSIQIDLGEMMANVVSNNGSSAIKDEYHNPEVTQSVPAGFMVTGDPLYLQQVFQNIFDNARIHTPDSGHITITALHTGSVSEITIQDDGCGIEKEDLEHIFEAYFSNRHGSQKSSGLGLYISNEIIRLHHGTIRVSSTVGAGTSFTVTLPV